MWRTLFSLAVAVLVVGCGPRTGPAPGPLSTVAVGLALSRYPGTSAETLGRGRQRLLDHCDECHGYPDLWFYEAAKWPAIMKQMGEKAELAPPEADEVLHFVLTAISEPRPGPALKK